MVSEYWGRQGKKENVIETKIKDEHPLARELRLMPIGEIRQFVNDNGNTSEKHGFNNS